MPSIIGDDATLQRTAFLLLYEIVLTLQTAAGTDSLTCSLPRHLMAFAISLGIPNPSWGFSESKGHGDFVIALLQRVEAGAMLIDPRRGIFQIVFHDA